MAKRPAAKRKTSTPAAVVGVQRLAHSAGLPLPEYQSVGAAGLDLIAACPHDAPIAIAQMGRELVPTGLALQIPPGFEGQVRPRSGLALRHGLTVLNSPGTIDSDYRGELMVLLVNLGDQTYVVERGERVAQLVMAPVVQATLIEVKSVVATKRGAGGFGSTGAKPARPAKPPTSTKKSIKRPRTRA